MPQSRREFLTASALASAGIFFTKPLSAFNEFGPSGDKWYLNMRRVAQHNLNEHDPQNLDIDKWVAYWDSLRLNAFK